MLFKGLFSSWVERQQIIINAMKHSPQAIQDNYSKIVHNYLSTWVWRDEKIIPWTYLTYKQIQHDVGDDDIEWAEVHKCPCVIATVCCPVCKFIWSTKWRLNLWGSRGHGRESTRTEGHGYLVMVVLKEHVHDSMVVADLKPSCKNHTCQTHTSFAAELRKNIWSTLCFWSCSCPSPVPLIEVKCRWTGSRGRYPSHLHQLSLASNFWKSNKEKFIFFWLKQWINLYISRIHIPNSHSSCIRTNPLTWDTKMRCYRNI